MAERETLTMGPHDIDPAVLRTRSVRAETEWEIVWVIILRRREASRNSLGG
jgi:hypothetical protein